jgi:hypothetical protein
MRSPGGVAAGGEASGQDSPPGRVWSLLPAVPASKAAGTDLGGVIVLDADATLVTAHSEKEHAAATFKHSFGFHPIAVWCDNTHELLAITLRPGNAGGNHAATTSMCWPGRLSRFRLDIVVGC